MSREAEMIESIYSGFIDGEGISIEAYRPKLLVNNFEKGQKVLSSLVKELENCEEFFFSVAFITQSGVITLLNTLKTLEERGIQGKIVASQYLNFTEPKALKQLLKFSNIELRMVVEHKLHAKGYIFKRENTYNLIVGSSNMTQDALSKNKEWNLKVSSMDKGSIVKETLEEFQQVFESAQIVDEQWIDAYAQIYQINRTVRVNPEMDQELTEEMALQTQIHTDPYQPQSEVLLLRNENAKSVKPLLLPEVMPNKMQVKALMGIQNIRDNGGNKALLISATGTGKTYLAGFDVKKVDPRKCLFLAHREQILNQSMESFKKVLGRHIRAGKLCGVYKEIDAQYLFSTVQTMSKESVLTLFHPEAFDYIVIDESHHVGSETYQKILKYFQPQFLLGMTATPERTDEHNIFNDFDHNIAYEIRLQEAMKEDMLCPFHYFGITEIKVDGKELDDATEFKYLVATERVENIISKAKFYGYHGDRVKGLVFCSRNDEAQQLSQMFNELGFHTVALTGGDHQNARDLAVERLEQTELANRLDYIFTVDIFNEGVDIPKVNQVIMLRPTQSAIIFVQQLGRGLRKARGKDFVVILDFIGNYEKNFMIPVALSDDRSFNKDTIRRAVSEGHKFLPGCSTVNFDAISRKKIFESIDRVKGTNLAKISKESYQILKYRLGRIPELMDFERYDSVDMALIFENKNYGSYYHFLKKIDKDYAIELTVQQEKMIKFISSKLAIGKRPHELLVLDALLKGAANPLDVMKQILTEKYKIIVKEKTITNVVNVLTNGFPTGGSKDTYGTCIFLERNDAQWIGAIDFMNGLQDPVFRGMLKELIDFGIYRYEKYYGQSYKGSSLQLYQKYAYEDVCRLLEWEKNEVPLNIGGYKYDQASSTFPVFINYHKDEDVVSSIQYEDRFESPSQLIALSKSKRTPDSNDVVTIYNAQQLGVDIELFVRKNKDDEASKEFYYLGRVHAIGKPKCIKMAGDLDAVEITYRLDTAVREDIYEYIVEV